MTAQLAEKETGNGPALMRLLMFTVTLSSMNALMFNIVLPQISEEFGLSYGQAGWLASAYTVLYAFGTVTYGKLADRFRLGNVLTVALVLFAAGSLVGLTAASFWTALIGRCLQSAGASCIPAMAMIVPARFFPPERRGRAMAMSAVGVALGSALAPVVSALIVSAAHWRWLFAPPLLVLALLPFFRRLLAHEKPRSSEAFDWLGGGLLAVTVGLLLVGTANRSGALAVCGLAVLALFILRIRAARHPFIRPALFRNGRYALALVLSFLLHAVGISLFVLTPKLMSDVHGLAADRIGFAMVPAALAAALLGRKGGKLADGKGNPFLFRIASLSLMACFFLLSAFAGAPPFWIAAFLVPGQVGQSFIGVAMGNTVSRSLPEGQVGVGMGLFSMLNFIAQGIAVSLYGLAVEWRAADGWNPLHAGAESTLYSNVYLVLAAVHAAILAVYLSVFREPRKHPQRRDPA
jgi:DHA2 family metal-tetracycline-proton antiporter-like MFS transporter